MHPHHLQKHIIHFFLQIVKSKQKSSVMAWNRAVISDIEESIDCGVDAVAISISVSDIHINHKLKKSREWVLENMIKSVITALFQAMTLDFCLLFTICLIASFSSPPIVGIPTSN